MAVPAPTSVAEPYHTLSSEAVVVWDPAASLGIVFESRVGFVFVAASEAEYMMAP